MKRRRANAEASVKNDRNKENQDKHNKYLKEKAKAKK
jgi:hypothetical protein